MLSYEQLTEQNRTLAALLAAERVRVRAEREKREVAEDQHALAARLLEELRKSYAILQQQHELLRRRIFEAKAERIDPTQLELEFAQTQAALDDLQKQLERAAATGSDIDLNLPPFCGQFDYAARP